MNGKFLGINAGVIRLDNKGTYVEIPVSGATPLPEHEKPERVCEVVRNGAEASLADLKQGDDVTLDGKPCVKITATGKKDEAKPAAAKAAAAPKSRAHAHTTTHVKGGKK